ncbi:MAG TPA: NAD(P)H-hydrate dehydratase [Pirellulales bacterium]|nr:NAD(P)H-hydrate dehydratase [Pirellulales bacterium]
MTTVAQLPKLPPRAPDSHKGDFGRVLLIGGSRDMPGSISLSGMAALRSGAGLVTIATPDVCQPIVAGFEPSYMTAAVASDKDGRIAIAAIERVCQLVAHATVVAIGPGLGQSSDVTELVTTLYREVPLPMVVDADGLNALAARRDVLPTHAGPRVLTPHPGEFARLTASDGPPPDRIATAKELAAQASVVVVLKGHGTVITDGSRHAVNSTGNPGMATGGTGDVLTGVVSALMAQQLAPFDAARLGVHVHGLAGDLAAAELGQVSLTASDLIRFLPNVFRQMT